MNSMLLDLPIPLSSGPTLGERLRRWTDRFFQSAQPDDTAGGATREDLPVDEATFLRFRNGDQEAMERIVEAYHARLIGFIRLYVRRQELAEEVAQEVFVAAWHQRAEINGVRSLRPWLFTLGKRKGLREAQRRQHRCEVAVEDEALADLSPELRGAQRDGLLSSQFRAALQEALESLSEGERDLVTLRYFGDLQIKELSAALDMPMGSVGVKLGRALNRIRVHFERRGLAMEDFLP